MWGHVGGGGGGCHDGGDAYIVEIEIDATVMRQDEVADGVCALDRLGVVVKGVEEPGILGCNQLA